MASGHLDFGTWEGRSPGGESATNASFTGTIAAGDTGTINLAAVPAGKEYFYQAVMVSCNDDSCVHYLQLTRISDGWVIFDTYFINYINLDFPGVKISAGEQLRISVTNNSSGALTFPGVIHFTSRSV